MRERLSEPLAGRRHVVPFARVGRELRLGEHLLLFELHADRLSEPLFQDRASRFDRQGLRVEPPERSIRARAQPRGNHPIRANDVLRARVRPTQDLRHLRIADLGVHVVEVRKSTRGLSGADRGCGSR